MPYVSIGGSLSKKIRLEMGIPQGSILGPLSFLICTNDLHSFMTGTSAVFFADHKTISANGISLTETGIKSGSTELKSKNWFDDE